MKTFEIVEGKNNKHRLTITPTRVTVKIRIGADDIEKQAVIDRAREAVETIGEVTQSWRGEIEQDLSGNWRVRVQNNNRSERRSV